MERSTGVAADVKRLGSHVRHVMGLDLSLTVRKSINASVECRLALHYGRSVIRA